MRPWLETAGVCFFAGIEWKDQHNPPDLNRLWASTHIKKEHTDVRMFIHAFASAMWVYSRPADAVSNIIRCVLTMSSWGWHSRGQNLLDICVPFQSLNGTPYNWSTRITKENGARDWVEPTTCNLGIRICRLVLFFTTTKRLRKNQRHATHNAGHFVISSLRPYWRNHTFLISKDDLSFITSTQCGFPKRPACALDHIRSSCPYCQPLETRRNIS